MAGVVLFVQQLGTEGRTENVASAQNECVRTTLLSPLKIMKTDC